MWNPTGDLLYHTYYIPIQKEKETMIGEEIPIEETRADRSGTDLVPQLEQLLAIAEVSNALD